MSVVNRVTKKRKFLQDGIFYAELNEFLMRELAEFGYAGVEVRVTPLRTEVIIRATRPKEVLGDKGRRIRELTAAVQKRFSFPENKIELFAERMLSRALSSEAQAESLRFRLLGGTPVRRACYSIIRSVMDGGARGCELIISGKLRGQRAKAMKFRDGYMIKSGQSSKDYVTSSVRHVLLRQGVIGVRVSIMLPYDPEGKTGPKRIQADVVKVIEPKD
eukprot:TRINITY_DN157_c0_g1_i1.p1 TRINITY_DN157_c0_g1~~TRINITY_DN157_c0_g1_i1.p1  ORF type:complete len:218 (-),score=99.65 TRINITY_DN157_c0_g1_i1:127-780(-)